MDRSLNIISYNAGGFTANKMACLQHYLNSHSIDIICIQESKFKEGQTKNIPGYNAHYRYHKNSNGNVCGGLIVYIKTI